MNIVILQGRLTKDCDVTYSSTGMVIARFSIAVDRPKKSNVEKREADFINCTVFGKRAEAIANYVSKGQRLLIKGSLRISNYTDKNGVKKYGTEVLVDDFDFIENAKGRQQGGAASSNASPFQSMGDEIENLVF